MKAWWQRCGTVMVGVGIPENMPALGGPADEELRSLVCKPGEPSCLYDTLRKGSSRAVVEAMLGCR
jgi:hypothetical protein